ncbi:unnamed protein product [Brugia pahangi]|uniref:Ovule protein n=1 Tax=Brugia pahangi TaxID=6280 RepID=A0A0N4SWZ5_BRUPA|nr:unnamed protein product [Brugia pahangi]
MKWFSDIFIFFNCNSQGVGVKRVQIHIFVNGDDNIIHMYNYLPHLIILKEHKHKLCSSDVVGGVRKVYGMKTMVYKVNFRNWYSPRTYRVTMMQENEW